MSPLHSKKIPSRVGSVGSVLLKKEAMKISEAMNNHQFYSNQEVIKISEAMDTPYNQRSDRKQKILIYSLATKLKVIKE